MPLPIALPSLFQAVHGRPPSFATDTRVGRWDASWRPTVSDSSFLRDSEVPDLESDFEDYRDSFLRALQAHGALHDDLDELHAMLPLRQASGSELGLQLRTP